ncbi:acetyl-CoA C-acetyltransferase [Jiangella anatolica]|uniref:Acetyl-CoA C-acyltransferase n=1 Tax=Jiangella anatolica TaxID=2670374 RepID=A0A2W2BPS9_9ACTN|nr:acetyl-CoA C-acetyltransferase [Jiangella anatolica]PZF82354.1 acetyl-CoA C-acyltransferase [Jiangella anatolica]
MEDAVIVSAVRSPIGRARRGSLTGIRADELAAQLIRAALDAVPELDPNELDDLLLGCGLPAGEQGYNLARTVAVRLGYDRLPGSTVTRFCASSLQSTRMAFHSVRAGESTAVVSAGVESVSRYGEHNDAGSSERTRNPYFAAAGRRSNARPAAWTDWTDPRDSGQVPDAYVSMGLTAENVAALMGIGRAEQDRWAARSQQRAQQHIANGHYAREITPVTLDDGTIVAHDDSPRAGTTVEVLAGLDPVFREGGSVTAGNSCPLNDGAAALVIMSATRAGQLGLTPIARLVSTAVSALSPEIMGLGPIEASRRALALAGMSIGDIDLVEINEAFAVQVLASARELGIDEDRLNVAGGAIALGHPFGMTGARMTVSLLNNLRAHDATLGLETMCIGGGQGMAMVLERLS